MAARSGRSVTGVTNETGLLGVFELLRLAPGRTWADLVAHVNEERRRFAAGLPPLNKPPWALEVGRAEIDGPGSGEVDASLTPGTHALVCALIDDGPNPIGGLFAIGPILVRD